MNSTELPENFIQLCEIADDVGLEGDYNPLLKSFNSARTRILKCGNDLAWRLMVHGCAPSNFHNEHQEQLIRDSRYAHHMVKAVNVRAWGETLGGALCVSNPEDISVMFAKAWEAINGRIDFGAQFDGRSPQRRWLKESFELATDPTTQDVRREMDEAPAFPSQSPCT